MSITGSKNGTGKFVKSTGRNKYWQLREQELKALIDSETGLIKEELLEYRGCPSCEVVADLVLKWRKMKVADLLWVKEGFSFWRCACGMVYVNPILKEDALHEVYKGECSADYWVDVLLNPKQRKLDETKFKKILTDVLRLANNPKSVIDIGCSVGHFLELARDNGFNRVVGLELNEKAYRHVKKLKKVNVYKSTLEDKKYPDCQFDVVTLFEVLEHISAPKQLLSECTRILKPNGLLVVLVPNLDSIVCRVLHDKAAAFCGRNHLNYFNLDTLTKILDVVNLTVIKSETPISDINTVWNYIHYEKAYEGNLRAPEWFEKFITKQGLGYKLYAVAKKL